MDDFDPASFSDGDGAAAAASSTGRSICHAGCGRPSRVCLCPYLPPSPLPTSTAVVILHHPYALRRNPLSTLPLLARSLSNLRLLPGRRLRPSSPPSTQGPVLLLYPSPAATDLASWCRCTPWPARAAPTLLLLDGTWRQAKEMHAASLPVLASLGAVPVALPVDTCADGDSMFESDLVVRKEPSKGCVSTMEAVARALRLLEPEGNGAVVEETMLRVLRAMVAFQTEHLQHRTVKPRVKMRKKKELKREEEMQRNAGVMSVTQGSEPLLRCLRQENEIAARSSLTFSRKTDKIMKRFGYDSIREQQFLATMMKPPARQVGHRRGHGQAT